MVVVKEASSTSAASSAKFTTAGTSAAQPSTSAAQPSRSAAPSTSAASSAGATSSPPVDLYAKLRLRQAGDEIEEKIAAALKRFKELSAKPSVSVQKNNKKTYACWAHKTPIPAKKK